MAKKQAKAEESTEAPAAAPAESPAAEEKKPRAPRGQDPRKKENKANPNGTAEVPAAAAPGAAAPKAQQGLSGEASKRRKGQQPGQPPKRGKKLREQLRNQMKKVTKEGPMPLKKAVGLLRQLKQPKFDQTVEIHMSLGIDATQSDQMIRGSVALPHGVGKSVRVLVFCQGDNVGKAKDAGADFAGSDELIKKIQGEGWLEFDVALATQDMMGQVSRLGKVLGPRGLMPTPKAGTVITSGQDVAAAVREFKAGKVEYRSDKGGNVHAGVGKMSFDDDKLVANVTTFVEQIRSVKPSAVKGHYVRSITLAGTMTPGIPVTM
jgi:large subunit ribosomal protein L1